MNNISENKIRFGWREWASLPSIGIPAIKVKIDTGARTSALHAFKIRPFKKNGKKYIRFDVHPVQKRKDIIQHCIAEVVDRRFIKDSGGHRELRYIIKTSIIFGSHEWDVEISLTNRKKMSFRMLLGRTAMGDIIVDTAKSFLMGKISRKKIEKIYSESVVKENILANG